MFKNVELSSDLLQVVNTKTFSSPEGPEDWFKYVVLIGVISLVGLIAAFMHRVFHAEDLSQEFSKMRGEINQIFRSTLVIRLCLVCASIVIPLVFYVNTKEHYWTAKHSAMLFTGFLGLCGWLAVCQWVPRFTTPYAWPVGIILISATLSTFRSVNMAEGIGYLFAIFGSAVFFFLASQVFTTSKRIHLVVVTLGLVAVVVSMYGLCQAYLLLPSEYVYAQETRAPVSTIGNKNYAAYYLDLTIPLMLALAVCRREPKQTLLALMGFFICRWHFALCDTRGGTIAMFVAISATIGIVAYYHGRRFRLVMYAILLEPLLWAAMSAAKITYGDTQHWGSRLNGREFRGQIGQALRDVLPKEYAQASSILQQAFMKANEAVLGANIRTWALVLGVFLALSIFWVLVRTRKDWMTHLGAAVGLAFLPYLFAQVTMPNLSDGPTMGAKLMEYARNSDAPEFGGPSKDVIVQMLNQYKGDLIKAASQYNDLFLTTHQAVGAMMSLTLFVVMAVFLLYRYYDDEEGWLPGLWISGAIGVWFLVFLFLLPGDSYLEKMGRMEGIWPKSLAFFHRDHPLLGLLFTTFSFAFYSVASLAAVIFATQWIPAHIPKEQAWEWGSKAKAYARYAIPAFALLLLLAFLMSAPVRSSVGDAITTAKKEGVVEGLFEGAHRFFNTKDQDTRIPRDGAIGFRLEIYQSCFRKMKDSWNWLLGIGPGNFKIIHPFPRFETALERRILGKEVLGRKAHNDFLEDAVENGIFGFMGLVWMFTLSGYLLYLCLKRIHPPRDTTDVFLNTITWGLCAAMVAIAIHANFEAPLLQPASTYPCWMLFGVIFQLYRIQKLRTDRARAGLPGVVRTEIGELKTSATQVRLVPSAAVYELPEVKPIGFGLQKFANPLIGWPIVLVLVTIMTGGILLRQYVGEMWLRWGMIFSQSGVERYADVFQCMEKAQDIYPQQMETNYILGRYCIDATQLVMPVWENLNGPSKNIGSVRDAAEQEAAQLRQQYQLDVDKLIDYAKFGVEVHQRDIYMNPNYKWAHNNMGVLCDKLSQIYEVEAQGESDPTKKMEYLELSENYEKESRNCYRKALEIDDLQVYALFNLGIGAYRDGNMPRAGKFFERTLLADPGKGDVNLFIARCRLAQEDLRGGVEACKAMFEWEERHPKNKNRPEGAPETPVIKADERRELEQLLNQVARLAQAQGELETAQLAAQTLVDQVDRCENLPLLARIEADLGNAQKALELGMEADKACNREAISAESYFAQAKAYCLLNDATPALGILNALMSNESVGKHFVDLIRTDKTFDLLKGTGFYETYISSGSSTSETEEESLAADSATKESESNAAGAVPPATPNTTP